MESDFGVDLDNSMLNYNEMDSLIGLPIVDNSSNFCSTFDEENSEHILNHGITGISCTISDNSASCTTASKRKRKPVDPLRKKPRIDYKTPFHAERLNLAIATVVSSLEGEPEAFHKNIMTIAKAHNIPYNTLRDNFLRARGIEPRAHRNSERKRLADAVAAAAERGVVPAVRTSNLIVQTHSASVHVAGALSRDLKGLDEGVPLQLTLRHSRPAPLPPRGLALALAMANTFGVSLIQPCAAPATDAVSTRTLSAESESISKVDDVSDDSGDDEV